jgi:hypothetical protein
MTTSSEVQRGNYLEVVSKPSIGLKIKVGGGFKPQA